MQIQFSTRQAISDACGILNKNWLVFILAFVAYFVVTSVLSAFGVPDLPTNLDANNPFAIYGILFTSSAYIGATLLTAVIGVLFITGFMKMCFDAIDNEKAGFDSFTKLSGSVYLNAFLAQVMCYIIVGLGTFLCIIPGIFLAVRLCFAQYYVVDRGLGPVEAIKAAWNDTAGNFWHLLGGIILICLACLAGYLLCCVGIIYTLPLAYIAMCILARVFYTQNQEIAE